MITGPHVLDALSLLYQASLCAADAGQAPWTFAVEMAELTGKGIDRVWLRWLITKGFIDHAHELATLSTEVRHFENQGRLRLTDASCFVLTEAGIAFAGALLKEALPNPCENVDSASNGYRAPDGPRDSIGRSNGHSICQKPHWNASSRELYFGGRVIKRFQRSAENQEAILAAFHEEDWPSSIDDPIVPICGGDSQQRLRASVQGLNRQLAPRALEFSCIGSGTAVLWVPYPLHSDLCSNGKS